MKHLVIVAHPRPDSLTGSLARAYTAELGALGHQHTLYDLYDMGFDPVLRGSELTPVNGQRGTAEVLQAQQDLEAAEAVAFIYPLWWLSMPAILKGFIDRVFARGFAYESHAGEVRPLLGGRKCILVTLSGAALPVLNQTKRWDAVTMLQDTHVFRAVGFDLLEHLHFDGIMPGLAAAACNAHLKRVRQCALEHFGECRTPGARIA